MFLITVRSPEKYLQKGPSMSFNFSSCLVKCVFCSPAYVSGDVPCFFMARIETIRGTPLSRQCEGQRSQKFDPALKDIIFQFVLQQSVMPATPKEFYSALRTLMKAHVA